MQLYNKVKGKPIKTICEKMLIMNNNAFSFLHVIITLHRGNDVQLVKQLRL
jgi:hypothetical protein